MTSSTVTIGSEAQMGYLAVPASGSGPGVIVLQEWWGLVKHIQDVCDRLAEAGFVALAPDLYHGETTSSPDDAGRMMMALEIDRATDDLAAAVTFLKDQASVTGSKVGVMGFCMGGQLALYAASKKPDIGACVNFYGIHPNIKPEYANIQCPVLGIFAENDEFVTPLAAHQLEADLQAAGVSTDFTIYPGCDHAFCNDSREDVFNADAAQQAMAKAQEFLQKHL